MDFVDKLRELDPVYKTLIGIELVITLWFGVYSLPFFLIFVAPALLKIYTIWSCGKAKSTRKLSGKVAIVTGANIGLGYETAKNFASRDAKVILACRNMDRGIEAADKIKKETGNQDVLFMKLDLSSLKSVREFCKKFLSEQTRLDILVNNAGASTIEKVITQDGLEENFAANHFGPFLLTNMLLDLMRSTGNARIVMVSSKMHNLGNSLELDNLNSEKGFNSFAVYPRTKLANVLMTRELNRRLRAAKITEVTVNALHPGLVKTAFHRYTDEIWYSAIIGRILYIFAKTPLEGAQTQIHVAVAEEVEELSGFYWQDCLETSISAKAQDVKLAKDLWEKSAQLVKLSPSETIF